MRPCPKKRKKRGKKRRDWEGEGDRKEMGEVKERLEQHTKVCFSKIAVLDSIRNKI